MSPGVGVGARVGTDADSRNLRSYSEPVDASGESAAAQPRELVYLHLVARRRRFAHLRSERVGLAAGVAMLVIVLFALVGVHVIMAQNQLRLDRLQAQVVTSQEQYQRLRLNVDSLESPSRIVAAAEHLGMRPPSQVHYLTPLTPAAGQPGTGQSSTGRSSTGQSSTAQSSTGQSSTGQSSMSAPTGGVNWPGIKGQMDNP